MGKGPVKREALCALWVGLDDAAHAGVAHRITVVISTLQCAWDVQVDMRS